MRRFEREVAGLRWHAVDAVPDGAAHRTPAPAAVVDRIARADIVLAGEYHPLPTACRTAAALLRAWQRKGIPCGLGLEMVHTRDQRVLDQFLAGDIGAPVFRRRIRYREEWGYPWSAPAALLKTARDTRCEVRALDLPPRGGVRDLARRDRAAAERIAHWYRSAPPGMRLVVLFGEAHLASRHLPAALAQAFDRAARRMPAGAKGRAPRVARVLHDLEHGPADLFAGSGAWLAAPGGLFARQAMARGARRTALARTWRAWAREEPRPDDFDRALLVHELISAEAEAVGIDPRTRRRGPARWLADELPEVFGPQDLALAARVLRSAGHDADAVSALIARATGAGAHYDARANVVLFPGEDFAAAALASARWLAGALCGAGPGREPGREPDPVVVVALAAIVEPHVAAQADGPGAREGAALAAALRSGTLDPASFRRRVCAARGW